MSSSFDWTFEKLEAKRLQGDPLADETITKIMDSGDRGTVNKFFRQLTENDELPLDEMPPEIREYLDQNSTFPVYTDWDLIKRGEKFYQTYGVSLAIMLLCKSLPASYACRKGADRFLPRSYPSILVRYLIGSELASMLQIKKYKDSWSVSVNKMAYQFFNAWSELKDDSELAQEIARKINMLLLEGIITYFKRAFL